MTAPKLVVLAKYPRPGEVKSRLIPALGADGAAELARTFFERTVSEGVRASELLGMDPEVRGSGAPEAAFRALHHGAWRYADQGGGDLGDRLLRSCREAAASGAPSVLFVGTDCPDLDASVCDAALKALRTHRVALAPATDGGYVLLGLRLEKKDDLPRMLFDRIPWGTDRVERETLGRLAGAGIRTAILPTFSDVDRPEDLASLRREDLPISVVIPARNESASIADAVRSALYGRAVDVIVADGGSADDTRTRAREAGSLVVQSGPGRGRQLNAGASEAAGEILLFLHADTTLPPGWAGRIRRAMDDPGTAGGAFRLSFRNASPGLAQVARWANVRARRLGVLFGDQGIFARASVFRSLGGFSDEPLMEDLAFVRALHACGRFELLPDAVETSGRRYERNGVFRTWLFHQLLLAGWFAGIPGATLARLRTRFSHG